MATTLVNLQRRRQLFELRHPVFYRRRWGYAVRLMRVTEHNPRTGEIGFREVKRKHPGTLTLLGGASIDGLPDEIRSVPAIRDAVRAGKVKLTDTKAAPKTAAKTAPKASPKPRRRRGGNGDDSASGE